MSKLPKKRFPTPAVQDLRMGQLFPGFRYAWRTASWTGILQPSPTSSKYRVQITYQGRGRPVVHVLEPQICEDAPHTYPDGSLCLYYHDGSWTKAKMLGETIIPWTAEWLYFYEYWLATGKWLGPEAPHGGKKEILEDL
jgi:hypothetical protein